MSSGYYMNGTRTSVPITPVHFDGILMDFWKFLGRRRCEDADDLFIIDEMAYVNVDCYDLLFDIMHADARRIYMAMKSASLVPRVAWQ
jgi:hypothetical protein